MSEPKNAEDLLKYVKESFEEKIENFDPMVDIVVYDGGNLEANKEEE